MKNCICSALAILCTFVSLAQVNFNDGYIVDKTGTKIECIIRNKNWTNTPKSITYKVGEETKTVSVQSINAFEVYGIASFITASVSIDESSTNPSQLSRERKLNYVQKEVLLKVLVRGEKSLYQYKDNGVEKFFFSTATEPITQLMYKKYAKQKGDSGLGNDFIFENKDYVTQLKTFIACSQDSKLPTEKFNQKVLTKFFITNTCSDSDKNSVAQSAFKQKSNVDLFFIGGVNNTELTAQLTGFAENSTLDDAIFERLFHPLIGFGVQIEAPGKKFTFVGELAYNFPYQSDNQVPEIDTRADFDYFSFIAGGRYHFSLGKNSSLFVGPNVFIYSILSGNIEPSLNNSTRSINRIGFNIMGEIGVQLGKIDIGFRQALPNNVFASGINGQFRNNQLYAKINIL